MKRYTFKIDDNNELTCTGIIDGKGFYKRGVNACKQIKNLDRHGEMNLIVDDKNVILYNHYWEIIIENAEQFIKSDYINKFKKNSNNIITKVNEANVVKKPAKKKYRVLSAITATAAITTAAVVIALNTIKTTTTVDELKKEKTITVKDEIAELKKQREDVMTLAREREKIRRLEEKMLKQRQAEEQAIAEYNTQKETILEKIVYIDVDQNWNDQRRYECEEHFADAIDEIAPRFGMSSNIIKAMACQEGGGYLPNVMQVATGWYYSTIDYYDTSLNRWHKITSTSGETHDTDDVLYVSLSDPNISVYFGCAVLARSTTRNHGDIFAGMIEYNRGNADGLVNIAANSEGVSHDEFLEDYYNTNIQYFDSHCYIQECLKFLDNEPITYTYVDPQTNDIEYITWYPTFKNLEEEDVIFNNLGEEPERVFTASENSASENKTQNNSYTIKKALY